MEARWFTAGAPTRPSASAPWPMPHMLPAPPKSSETRAIMLLISRDSEHAAVVDEGAELELGKPDEGAGQEPVRCTHRARRIVALRPLLAVDRDEVLEGAELRILGDLIAVPGLDTLRRGGRRNPLNRFFNP